MSLVVVGPVGFESIGTPYGCAERTPGGAGVYAAVAATFFTDASLVGVVGEDFADEHHAALTAGGVCVDGLVRADGEATPCWVREYDLAMQLLRSHDSSAGVLDRWQPSLAPAARAAETLMLGPLDPHLQRLVLADWHGAKWVGLATCAHWVETKREALVDALQASDIAFLNGRQARALSGKPLALEAAHEIHSWGPRAVVLDLADHGYAVLHEDGYFSLPAHPVEQTVDPTGTGTAFAGGLLGYLDRVPEDELSLPLLRDAAQYGAAIASYCAESLGWERLATTTEFEVMRRASDFNPFTHFERESVATGA